MESSNIVVDTMSLAENLKKLIDSRQDLSSPSDFAKKAGISRQTVNSMVRGKVKRPNSSTVEKITTYFDCAVDDLVEPINSRVSEKLHQLMKDEKININQLSKKTGIGSDQISRILNKKILIPTDRTLEAFSSYFNVSMRYFD